MTELKSKRTNTTWGGTRLPWATDAKLVRSEETGQMLCDLNDDGTRSAWLDWGKDNEVKQ